MNERHTDDGRIDYETSPSTGWRETAEIMHAPDAHAVEATSETDDLDDITMFRDSSTTFEVAP